MGGRHRGGRSRHALGRSQTVSRVRRPADGRLVDTNVCAHARGRGARRRDRTGIDRTHAGALRASCARARAGDRSRRRDAAAERLRGLTRSLGAVRRCLRPRRRASARARGRRAGRHARGTPGPRFAARNAGRGYDQARRSGFDARVRDARSSNAVGGTDAAVRACRRPARRARACAARRTRRNRRCRVARASRG